MATIFCNACSKENDCNSIKCEHCKSALLDEDYLMIDNCEEDFRFIEEAELKGEFYKLECLEGIFSKVEPCENMELQEYIKEPELQIEADILVDQKMELVTDFFPDQSQYQCNKCTKSFKRKAALKAHYNTEHCSRDSDSDEPVSNRKSVKSTTKDIIMYKCKTCNKTMHYSERNNHINSHKNLMNSFPNGSLNCQKYKTFLNLKIHQGQHKDKNIYKCDICYALLSNETVLKQHKIKIHNGNTEGSTKDKKFRCTFCGEMFEFQILMTNHKKTHMEDTQQIEETAFIRRVDGRMTYHCKICGKSSSNKSRHTDHIRVHTKEKPFKCNFCETKFTANASLIQHMRLHSDERPFECHICEKTYRHKKNLRRHLLVHSGARPFKCQYCDKTFPLKTTKLNHERQIHTGETPYQCKECGLWFTTSCSLNSHRRVKHDVNTNSKRKVEILTKSLEQF